MLNLTSCETDSALLSAIRQHCFDTFLIAFGNQHVNIEQALTLCGLLRQNVARVRMAALDFAGRGRAEPFGRAPVSFQLRHNSSIDSVVGEWWLVAGEEISLPATNHQPPATTMFSSD
jgi:hypothetical protein